jgi:hypothetical protein
MIDNGLPEGWELVVGLEVHVELATKTKLFSGSPNRFGDEPNTNIDPVTLGLPGALPVLNQHAVELAMRIGLALNHIKPERDYEAGGVFEQLHCCGPCYWTHRLVRPRFY